MADAPPESLLAFRRRAISLTARVLAVGLLVLAVLLELTNPVIVAVDVLLLVSAAAVHAVAAATVGRRWDPGGGLCLAYLLVITLLISVSFVHAGTPQSDAFWFLLIPVGLSAVTMPALLHAAVTSVGLALWPVMVSLGPGVDVPLTISRTVSMALFGLAIFAFTRRLEQALVDVDTARGELAERLAEVQRLNDRLTELDRAKDDFVSSVSHELRTPLTVVQGLTRTLESRWTQLDDDQRHDLARRLGANARGLEGIVSALLDLARIERGGFEPNLAPVRLAPAVDESLLRLEPVLRSHPVTVDVPRTVTASTDLRLLERVLDNLLANAARHTAPGTQVHVRAAEADGGVRIEVADQGVGMTAAEVERLGEQFYRAGAVKAVDNGIGLGLALVRDVLAALGTQLEVRSRVGRGTTFAFVLPPDDAPEPTRDDVTEGTRAG